MLDRPHVLLRLVSLSYATAIASGMPTVSADRLLVRTPPTVRCLGSTMRQAAEAWLADVYESIDYEAVLFSDEEEEQEQDDFGADEFIYGESSLPFFLQLLDKALDLARPASISGAASGFCDLGGGKGQLALAAAREEPDRLSGTCFSLELMPELHRMGAAAFEAAAAVDPDLERVVAQRGSIYDVPTLDITCGAARVVFAYATKFESVDGEHVERLSAALAASQLPAGAIVITVNRRLHPADGWKEVAAPVQGEVPHETSGRGTAFFWQRAGE